MNPITVASLYQKGADTARLVPRTPEDSPASSSFETMLKGLVETAVDSGHKAEALGAKAAEGQASLIDLTRAVKEAQQNLDTVVAVRNKLVTAFQEIMRMPI